MARTIEEIKQEMTGKYLSHEVICRAYGLPLNADFEVSFSKASIESILFYVFAFSVWTLEKMFDSFVEYLTNLIESLTPGTLRWMTTKAKQFMPGYELLPDTDRYDYTGMTTEDIEAAQVVKHAAAVENNAIVYLKVAGDNNGEPEPLSSEHEAGLNAYIKEIKYAGVVVEVINKKADHYRLKMIVFYNPMILSANGTALLGGDPVRDTIRNFLKSLPFNSEYRNVDLVDTLQAVPGVVIPELIQAEVSPSGLAGTWTSVEAIALPDSGYYKIYNDDDLDLEFRPYEAVSN